MNYKLNKLYLNKKLSNLLDNNTIDFEVYNVLNQWRDLSVRYIDTFISIRKRNIDGRYFERPMTQAMLDECILFFHKYNKQVRLEQYVYRYVVFENLQKKYKFSILERIYYTFYYWPVHTFNFSSDGLSMGQSRTFTRFGAAPWEHSKNLKYHGYNPKYDVPMELYKGKLNHSTSSNGVQYPDTY
jgi:hypothetical protein